MKSIASKKTSQPLCFGHHVGRVEAEAAGSPRTLPVVLEMRRFAWRRWRYAQSRVQIGVVMETGALPLNGLLCRLLVVKARMLRVDGGETEFDGVLE